MGAQDSYLSHPKYGYDFVVATDQASINAGLREYLHASADTEPTYICYLADPNTGNPTTPISLDELKKKTGVDPFDIPAGTDYNDPRIEKLTKNLFVVGLKLKMGLPPGILPKDLPPVVELGDSADNVAFNMFCSELEIIQNTPGSGFNPKGKWNVWTQPSGKSWHFSTKVDLVYKDLDKELDTPYFRKHPEKRVALLAKLKNLSGNAFSLQQLLFDLDNATVQSVPTIEGLDKGSNAALILQKAFVDLYAASAKEQGDPLLSVHAVTSTPDHSSLRLTGMEREVCPMVDGSGQTIKDPTHAQKEATTLAYLCAVNNNALPGVAGFNWNWVEPAEAEDDHGIIAINRYTLAEYLKHLLMPSIKQCCIKYNVSSEKHGLDTTYHYPYSNGHTPQTIQITDSGEKVLHVAYSSKSFDDAGWGPAYSALGINCWYTCDVSFRHDKIEIVQHLKVQVSAKIMASGSSPNVFDKTIVDKFQVSVDQNGGLQIKSVASDTIDHSQKPDLNWFENFFTQENARIDDITGQIKGFIGMQIHEIPAAQIRDFVFPGGNVFAFKNAQFSDHQDLITHVTYVRPN